MKEKLLGTHVNLKVSVIIYCVLPVYSVCYMLYRFEKQDGVVLMATSRNLKQIDEALQRPGRMDRIFHLQRPTQAEREKILRISAKETMDEDLIDFVDWRKVIRIIYQSGLHFTFSIY